MNKPTTDAQKAALECLEERVADDYDEDAVLQRLVWPPAGAGFLEAEGETFCAAQ